MSIPTAPAHKAGMTKNMKRVLAGVPAGGQFDTHDRDESEVALAAGKRDRIETELEFEWLERNVLLTPRHRKPQDVLRTSSVIVGVDVVDIDDAPVAFTVTQAGFSGEEDTQKLYRMVDGKLFAQALTGRSGEKEHPIPVTPEWLEYSSQYRRRYIDVGSEAAAAAQVQSSFDGTISIDGEVWVTASEPAYKVMTFGMGGNHGGTSLSIDSAPEDDRHAASTSFFPADQYEEAVKYAIGVALDRGDDKSVDRITSTKRIQVAGGFAPGSTWRPAPRIDYTAPWDLSTQNFATELAVFRSAIASVPGSLTEVSDGFGGTTKRVDYSVFTERQADDYKNYLKFGAENGLIY